MHDSSNDRHVIYKGTRECLLGVTAEKFYSTPTSGEKFNDHAALGSLIYELLAYSI